MKQIRIHGRAGVHDLSTAGFILGKAAMKEGKYVQIRPPWTPDRQGQPQVCFIRIDKKPIRDYSQVYNIDIALVMDSSLVSLVDVFSEVKQEGRVIINGPLSPGIKDSRMICLDVDTLCRTEQIDPVLVLLGYAVKLIRIVSLNSLKMAVCEEIGTQEKDKLMKAIDAGQHKIDIIMGKGQGE